MNLVVVSIYAKETSSGVVSHQKKVFDFFDTPVCQTLVDCPGSGKTNVPPGNVANAAYAMDQIVKQKHDYYIFFDIDAIPLKKGVVDYIMGVIEDHTTLFGIVQQSGVKKPNGIANHLYAAPACMGFSYKLYLKLGSPSFLPNSRGDGGEELTWRIESRQKVVVHNGSNVFNYNTCPVPPDQLKLKLLFPTHSIGDPDLNIDIMKPKYANGTIYGDMVFHAGGSFSKCEMFINKCKEVLGEKS